MSFCGCLVVGLAELIIPFLRIRKLALKGAHGIPTLNELVAHHPYRSEKRCDNHAAERSYFDVALQKFFKCIHTRNLIMTYRLPQGY